MKILIYGAGVVGSFFAVQLKNGGHDVWVLARGKRLSDIQEHGIVLEDALTGRQTVTHIDVVETLKPEDKYDTVLVTMRKNQVKHILPILAENKTPAVIFMVNNAEGPAEFVNALGADRVFFSFSATGGVRKGHITSCLISKSPMIPLGGTSGQTQHTEEIIKAFSQAHINTHVYDMDGWLKYHVALVSPLGNAVLLAGSNYQLAKDKNLVRLMIRAVKEGFNVLEHMGYPVTPRRFVTFKWVPERVLEIFIKKALNTKRAEIAVSGHALHAVDEMKQLSNEFQVLVDKSGVDAPAIRELHRKVMDTNYMTTEPC